MFKKPIVSLKFVDWQLVGILDLKGGFQIQLKGALAIRLQIRPYPTFKSDHIRADSESDLESDP